MTHERWQSRLGFILAASGSAVGLANIWKFPYIVGRNGGAAFVALYLLCLLLIGIPVFIAEILIGRTTQTSPSGAFRQLAGPGRGWSLGGKLTILTGFIVSSFYSAVAGWILGYLVQAFKGNLSSFSHASEAEALFEGLRGSAAWAVGFHGLFLGACVVVLLGGVRHGIERASKILMPMLYIVLFLLVAKGLSMPRAGEALQFLLRPDWSALTPTAILTALGHSFFTLSLGQGTMVTYGSYLSRKDNLVTTCLPVAIMDTFVSLFVAVAIFTIVFSVGIEPTAGPGLIFQTLPMVFSQLPGGYALALLFFLLVVLAALTSEISAMEPGIAYLVGEKGWSRGAAVLMVGAGAFLLGIPSALSFSWMAGWELGGVNFFEALNFVSTSILIPLGGFLAVALVGWIWGVPRALEALKHGCEAFYEKRAWLRGYFWFCFKYSAPILITLVFLNALGIFG